MKHLIISREFPPAPGGGIGTYVSLMASALAARGETVHVIGQLWEGAARPAEVLHDGRLIVHRIPYTAPGAVFGLRRHRDLADRDARRLFDSATPAMAFAWQAAAAAEALIDAGDVDVVEAQEYEAPLYFLQQRRAAGQGTRHAPPFIVHLHSPTALIAEHNRWAADEPGARMLTRLERLSVLAADAIVSPSRFLAEQVAASHGLDPQGIDVIPYPLAPGAVMPRNPATWRHGSVLYMGRLEPRKGAEEWLTAVSLVAERHPGARFVFAGNDVLHPPARTRVPAHLRHRVTLAGHLDQEARDRALASARLVVVPSRWDNYPYTCMEAMASGVPVLTTAHGGMPEMVEAGVSGWIAQECDAPSLSDAASAIMDLAPDRLAEVGAAAAQRIRSLCAAEVVIPRHLELRERVRAAGSGRSAALAGSLPWVPLAEITSHASPSALGAAARSAIVDPAGAFRTLIARVRARWWSA